MLISNINRIKEAQANKNVLNKQTISFAGNETVLKDLQLAKVSVDNLKAYTLTFTGEPPKPKRRPTDRIARSTVSSKQYQGKGLFVGPYVDWNKVGWENLKKEPINWRVATKDTITTFYHALALAETKDTDWVRKYNETNVPEPLAEYHTSAGYEAKKYLVANLNQLKNIYAGKDVTYTKPAFLDKPLINPETKKFSLECTVFDTETTGTNDNPKVGPVDKIIEIGAVKVNSDGEVMGNTSISQLINPEMPINPDATEVHHITNEMLKDKPVIEHLLSKFLNQYLQDEMIVAYNAKFDIPMLNRAVNKYNEQSAVDLNNKAQSLAMDPYIIIQRIHPFVGVKKKLGDQYKFLFGRDIENAHDALSDVKATVDILKYCCYYLQKHANRPLTVNDMLTFQFGGKVEGLDVKLGPRGYDAKKNYQHSYHRDVVGVKNYPDGYLLTEPLPGSHKQYKPIISSLVPDIGEENAYKLFEMRNKRYKTKEVFVEYIKTLNLTPYNNKTVDDIINIIVEKAVNYINNKNIPLWRKNIDFKDIPLGNDLPEFDISKKVMLEREQQDKNDTASKGRDLDAVLADMSK